MTHLPSEEPNEKKLRSYYESFGGDHDRLRSKLLAALSVEAVPTQVVVSPDRTGGQKSTWLTFPRWASQLVPRLTIAALLFVVIGLSMLHRSGTTQTVYGMEHLAERLLTIRSLYIKGWMYYPYTTEKGEEKTEKVPIEQYFRRPNCLAFTHYGFSASDNGKPRVSRISTASDGKRTMAVTHNNKTAFIAAMPQDPFDAELLVESQIQSHLVSQFLQGHSSEYRKLRAEKVGDTMCDLYVLDIQNSKRTAGRHYLWMNLQTGIPAKIESYEVDEEGEEQLAMSTMVRVNVKPPAALFSFRAPEGYQVIDPQNLSAEDCEDLSSKLTDGTTVTKNDPTIGPKLSYVGAGGSGTDWLATWHALRIDDRAALVCWHQYDTDKDTDNNEQKHWFARQPKFELYQGNQSRACTEQTITTNQVGDTQWRWSLIHPDDGEPLGEEILRFGVSDKKSRTSQELKPLRFPEKRLQEILLEAQRRSLPDGTQKKLFTLKELRTLLQAKP